MFFSFRGSPLLAVSRQLSAFIRALPGLFFIERYLL